MAFVNERHITPEQQAEIEQMTVRLKKRIAPSNWTIDRERGATLLCFGVGRYSPYPAESTPGFYALIWRGEEVVFEAYTKDSGTPGNSRDVTTTFVVLPFQLPPSLETRHEELPSLIREALNTKRRSSPLNITNVIVEFSPNHNSPW